MSQLQSDKDNIDFIVLASDLDELIDEIEFADHSDIAAPFIKRLNYLIKDFHEFKQAIKNIELHKREEKTTQV